jgi:SAM-dependent methyltransferase
MEIVKNVLKQFGIQISRYKQKMKIEYPTVKFEEIISEQEALEANHSVGRKHKQAPFTYLERIVESTRLMDDAENKWWNKAGPIIEEAWVMQEEPCIAYRELTIKSAVAFFLKDKKKVKVLDLGCGSGWMGRMMAGESLEYLGMDFSSTQISIANAKLKECPNKEFIKYYCLEDIRKVPELSSIDGVVINAFLHHLSWNELHELFRTLCELMPSGCKIFIVEPIYPDGNNIEQTQEEVIDINTILLEEARSFLEKLKKKLVDQGIYDLKAEHELILLIEESARNGFFLSPKEVPFKISDFLNFLGKYAQIERYFHCGVCDLELAQLLTRVKSEKIRTYLINTLFPYIRSIDDVLIGNGVFNSNPDTYLFTAFECVLKK